jgi:fructose-1,6-bisphosphatase
VWDNDEDDSSSSSDVHSDDMENIPRRGQTFCVNNGRLQLLENGMTQYVRMVEKKLGKRKKPILS